MLSAADNDLLSRVGPGSPMGDLMRQYWIPALMSSELPASDGPPMRVRLLGEDLVAFRTTSGAVGLLAHTCLHRGSSLFYGRNEEDGLRCVYHGWKYGIDGRCVDMPNEPAESNFKDRVRATAYPCQERGGVVWAYMGPRGSVPPLPDLEPNMQPEGRSSVWLAQRECNWAQALEGDIDTSHLAFLHLGAVSGEDVEPGTFDSYIVRDRTPRFNVTDTDYGTMYGAYRPADDDTYYWRIAHFMFPFFTLIPTGVLGVQMVVRAWVPMDDGHTMYWNISVPGTNRGGAASTFGGRRRAPLPGTAGTVDYLPNTTDWLGRWRLSARVSNDHGIDREAQQTRSYTGIDGIHLQDQAITESMGPLIDRTAEHLGKSDAMVIKTRRRMLAAAIALRDQGTRPPGVDDPAAYRVRSGGVVLPRDADWLEATAELRRAFVPPPAN